MRDLYSDLAATPALAPAVQAAAATGGIIDTLGKMGLVFVVTTGAIAGDGDFGVTLQESDTTAPGDFADADPAVIDSDAPATLAAASAFRLGYRGFKRYVRLSLTKAGGTSIAAGAVAVFAPSVRPVA